MAPNDCTQIIDGVVVPFSSDVQIVKSKRAADYGNSPRGVNDCQFRHVGCAPFKVDEGNRRSSLHEITRRWLTQVPRAVFVTAPQESQLNGLPVRGEVRDGACLGPSNGSVQGLASRWHWRVMS